MTSFLLNSSSAPVMHTLGHLCIGVVVYAVIEYSVG
jgi:hypothetical protein